MPKRLPSMPVALAATTEVQKEVKRSAYCAGGTCSARSDSQEAKVYLMGVEEVVACRTER